MKAINDVRRYVSAHSNSPSAAVLARLPETLAREEKLELRGLYTLDWESFELAIELMRDWRIDRYYADRTNLIAGPAEPARALDAPSKHPDRSATLETAA